MKNTEDRDLVRGNSMDKTLIALLIAQIIVGIGIFLLSVFNIFPTPRVSFMEFAMSIMLISSGFEGLTRPNHGNILKVLTINTRFWALLVVVAAIVGLLVR